MKPDVCSASNPVPGQSLFMIASQKHLTDLHREVTSFEHDPRARGGADLSVDEELKAQPEAARSGNGTALT